jgi:3-phosphoshikimate 1-carboxyvinyltransferase
MSGVTGGGLRYVLTPGGRLVGTVRVPGDKSISHRAVMLASLAEGVSEISGFLAGEDCLCTMRAFQQMGVRIERLDETRLRVHGVGLHGLQAPAAPLDLGNSGTSMRLMAGLLAAQPFASTLIGDASLSRRPMQRVIEPLSRMGARIDSQEGRAPLVLHPVAGLSAIHHVSAVASAQVKSCVLLAGLYARGQTAVSEPETSRDHTERMLRAFGVSVETRAGHAALSGGQTLRATDLAVPADISSAAFFLVGAAITPGSDLLLQDVGMNPTRTGVIHILQRMGAQIEILNPRELGGEPVADLRVQGGALRGIEIGAELVASAIDEFPALFVAAACARGETLVSGAQELRVKESDRIQTMCDGLRSLGISAVALPDGARILGGRLCGGVVDAHGDHRVAMSFAMAGLRAEQPITILDCANVQTSFPGFAGLAAGAGLRLRALPA